MKFFTYEDYIECIHKLRLNAIFQIAEEGERYGAANKKEKYEADKRLGKSKMIKAILGIEEEAAKLINNFLNSNENVKKEDLIKWNSNYIINKYKLEDPILIYKQKRTETFFLIEHVESMDSLVSFKILNYCIDIIYEWSKNRRFNSNLKYPRVVPIVIYTGKEKWNRIRRIEGGRICQDKGTLEGKRTGKSKSLLESGSISQNVLENYKVDIQLNVIETRRLSDKFLIGQKSLFRKCHSGRKFKNIKSVLKMRL